MEALSLPPVCGCGHYTVQDKVPQSILPLFNTEEDSEKVWKKWANFCGREKQNYREFACDVTFDYVITNRHVIS